MFYRQRAVLHHQRQDNQNKTSKNSKGRGRPLYDCRGERDHGFRAVGGLLLDHHQQRHQAQLLRGRGDRDGGAPGPDHGLHPAEQPPLRRQQRGQHDDW